LAYRRIGVSYEDRNSLLDRERLNPRELVLLSAQSANALYH
jgi:hypothetical protein